MDIVAYGWGKRRGLGLQSRTPHSAAGHGERGDSGRSAGVQVSSLGRSRYSCSVMAMEEEQNWCQRYLEQLNHTLSEEPFKVGSLVVVPAQGRGGSDEEAQRGEGVGRLQHGGRTQLHCPLFNN